MIQGDGSYNTVTKYKLIGRGKEYIFLPKGEILWFIRHNFLKNLIGIWTRGNQWTDILEFQNAFNKGKNFFKNYFTWD